MTQWSLQSEGKPSPNLEIVNFVERTLLGKVTWCDKLTFQIDWHGGWFNVTFSWSLSILSCFPRESQQLNELKKIYHERNPALSWKVWNELTKRSSDLHCFCCLQKPVDPYLYLSFLSSLGMLNCPAAAPPVRTKGRMMAPRRNACFTWTSGERSEIQEGDREPKKIHVVDLIHALDANVCIRVYIIYM